MRILQLIDSLDAGGAERMAVNYANGLTDFIELSALVATRKEGILKKTLSNQVAYQFVNKKNNLDFIAFYKLHRFCRKMKITHIHAHSSSFFWAVLLKFSLINVKIIWHDHFGNRVNALPSTNKMLIRFSRFFDTVITVNGALKKWAIQHLDAKKIVQLPNFILSQPEEEITLLNGTTNRRIVLLANLKKPKNHLFFLEVFHQFTSQNAGWSLHLIGQDFDDEYANVLKKYIQVNSLENVYFYGQCSDVRFILQQSTIGVLASTYEGFPVTLLEYANKGLILFSTNVGDCEEIIQSKELLFSPKDKSACVFKLQVLAKSVEDKNPAISQIVASVNERILQNYSKESILKMYLKAIK